MDGRPLFICALAAAFALCACDAVSRGVREGNERARLGDHALALDAFRRAADAAPDDARAQTRFAHALLAWGDPAEARPRLERVIAHGGDAAFDARLALARIHLRGGEPRPALAAIAPALAERPDDVAALLLRAAAHLQTSDAAALLAAARDAERAAGLAPTAPEALYLLGCAQLAQGQSDQAQRTFERLSQAAPESALSWYGLARVGAAKHDLSMVTANLQQARSKWRGDEGAAIARDPAFRHLREDPAFLRAVGAP